MKRSLLLMLVVASIGSVFSSCKKNSTSYNTNPATGTQMDYQLVATNLSYSVTPATPGLTCSLVWTSGFANPDVVVFQATQKNLQVQLKSTNTQQIDVMSSLAVDFGTFALPAGFYDKTSLKMDLDRNGASPSFELNGQFTNGATSVPVMLEINDPVVIQTDQDSVTISNDSSYDAVTTLDLSTVTSGITASMLLNAQLTNGTIVISDMSNRKLYDMVLDDLNQHPWHCWFHHHGHGG